MYMKKNYQMSNLVSSLPTRTFKLHKDLFPETWKMNLIKMAFAFLLCSLITLLANNDASASVLNNNFEGYTKADTIVVKGVVKDMSGPLPGVSVKIKGNNRVGTVTDANGKFSLEAADNATLILSFVGYLEKEVNVTGNALLSVVLVEDSRNLDEIVVIGYGTQSREKLIGSVAQITGETLRDRPVSQLKNALTGQMPGVTITQRNGSPGVSSGTISVRGVGSFGASPNPLVIVDGTPIENFNDIDPNDVESISVLKDASSAAIYGSRAANGVIIVTTKSGKMGKPKLNYASYFGLQKPTALPEYINSWEYAIATNEANNSVVYSDADIQKFKDGTDPNFPNTSFLKAALSKDGAQTGHNLSINGGSDVNKYNLSFGYLFQDGIVVNNDYSRYNVRLNMTTALDDKFTLITRLAAINSKVNEPMAPAGAAGFSGDMLGIIGQAARTPPIYNGRLPNGDFDRGLGFGTTVANLASESFYMQKNVNLNGSLRLDYQVINDLKLSALTSYVQNNGRESVFRSTQRINASLLLGPNFKRDRANTNGYYTFQGLAEYNKQLGKNNFSVLGGYSFESYKSEDLTAFRDNLPGNDLTVLAIGSLSNQQSDGTAAEYALESQFLRANYNYSGKYLLEGVVRRDASSRFPQSRKTAIFPSVAAGWRIGEEGFIKDNLPWISELKLKASWGKLGNQNISNYPYQRTLVTSDALSYSFGGAVAQGAASTRLVDDNLHWETTRTTDVGIEAGVLKNKINLSATYFDRLTYDILYAPTSSVSSVLGLNLAPRNIGKLKNSGWEFTANHANTINKFSYNVNGNFTIVHNKVTDLGIGNIPQPNGLIGNGSSLFLGYPASNGSFGIYYGYVADGLFTDANDVLEYQKLNDQKAVNPGAVPGDIRYKDISGPNGIPDGKVDATYDRVILGSQIPKYSYGLNLGGGYGGFDLNVLLQGIAGVTGRLQGYSAWAFFNTRGNVQRFQYEGRWTAANPDRNAIYPRFQTTPNSGVPNTTLSSFWTLNASYLRIKNLQLGYKLPSSMLNRVNISNARLYLSGENLHTFSSYRKGWDPEINTTSQTEFYPLLSTYTIGLNITL